MARTVEQVKAELKAAKQAGNTKRKNELLSELIRLENPEEALADEVFDRLGRDGMNGLYARNQKSNLKLEFYRREDGVADYRFRPLTEAEQYERATDWVEDNL